jgi:hypothetical protein
VVGLTKLYEREGEIDITRKLSSVRTVTLRTTRALKAAENTAEKAQGAALIGGREVEATKH